MIVKIKKINKKIRKFYGLLVLPGFILVESTCPVDTGGTCLFFTVLRKKIKFSI